MTRELDIEIARLDGCEAIEYRALGSWRCLDGKHGKPPNPFANWASVYYYSEDLNTLMELIRRRWPNAVIVMSADEAYLYKDYDKYDAHESCGGAYEYATDAERLAYAVRDALWAEQPQSIDHTGVEGYFTRDALIIIKETAHD